MNPGKHSGKRFDGYIRVSRVGDREGDSFISPSDQREKIEGWARLREVTIQDPDGWHEDLDQTGGKLARPGLDRMMDRVRGGQTDGIVVARLDRLSRAGVADALRLVEEVHEHGGEIAALDLGIDPTTTFGEFALTIMLALARMERRRITENWDTANRRAIERGVHFTARIPFGYRRGEDKRLEPDPVTAPVVAEIYSRRAAKHSRWSIADWMNQNHPRPDGREWTARNMEVILQNRVYLGEAFHGEHRNPNAHPPILTLREFDAAASVEGGTGRLAIVGGGAGGDGDEDGALLAGLIRCAGCRYAMRRTFTTYRSGEKHHLYSCQKKHGGGVCREPASVMAHLVEPLVAMNVLALVGGARWQAGGADDDALRAAEAALDQAKSGLEAFLGDDDLRAIVSREAYLQEAEGRQRTVEQAEREVEEARKANAAAEARGPHVLVDDWASWPRQRQSETLRTVLDTVYVKKGRTALDSRVLLAWDGEDEYERPVRGSSSYRVKPIPWPSTPADPHAADVPALARQMGLPFAMDAHAALTAEPAPAE